MPVVYTVFPLNSTSTVNSFSTTYEVDSPDSALVRFYEQHLFELITYQIGQIVYSDCVLYKLVAGGKTLVRAINYESSHLRSPRAAISVAFPELSRSSGRLHTESNITLVPSFTVFR